MLVEAKCLAPWRATHAVHDAFFLVSEQRQHEDPVARLLLLLLLSKLQLLMRLGLLHIRSLCGGLLRRRRLPVLLRLHWRGQRR